MGCKSKSDGFIANWIYKEKRIEKKKLVFS